MSGHPNKLSQFWQELKDRKVLRAITVFVAIVFGLLELIDIISGPFNLPGWILNIVIIVSVISFPIVLLISWSFYFSQEGIKRYIQQVPEPSSETQQKNMALQSEQFTDSSYTDGVILFESDSLYPALSEKREKRKERIYSLSSVTIIGMAVVFFLFFSGRSAPFQERDWVVIGDVVNHTKDPIFDKSLNTALEIGIDQSRYINVVSRKRIQETLKRIKQDDGAFIDEELCRELAIREGAKVYIIPEISEVGLRYILSGRLKETVNGSVIRSEMLYINDQSEIIQNLGKLCKRMRRHLGESRYKISGQNKPLAKVTTSSIEALKQFTLGIEYHTDLRFDMAVTHYENAIRIDSNFTSAKASLGNLLYERFDREKGKMWLDEAIQSVDNLTDQEKYGILAFYAANVEKDLERSIEYTRVVIDLYPDKAIAYNNLGWYYQNLGRYEEAVHEYKRAIRLNPYAMITYGGLLWVYLEKIGNIDSSFYWAEEMIKYGPDNPWGYFYLGSAYIWKDKFEEAKEAYEKAWDLNPDIPLNQYRLAHTYRLVATPEKAVGVLKEILQLHPNEAPAHYDLGIYYQLIGEEVRSRDHFSRFKTRAETWEIEYPDHPGTYIALGCVLSRLGDKEAGWEAGKRAIEVDSTEHFRFAELLAVLDKKEEALDHLEIALKNGYRDLCWITLNPDISLLKDEDRYKKIIEEYFR